MSAMSKNVIPINTTKVVRYSECRLPTEYGEFDVYAYRDPECPVEHLAIVNGPVDGREEVLVRVHSECLTGEVLHSLKCDCREQLALGLERIAKDGGIVLYLRQEGRGIGLGNKIAAYRQQELGHDTVDANRVLGFGDDLRRYDMVPAMLDDLGVKSVVLMTNNPAKIDGLERLGVDVVRREAHAVAPHERNRGYLATKQARMKHMLDLSDE